jgi:hypothetical protein
LGEHISSTAPLNGPAVVIDMSRCVVCDTLVAYPRLPEAGVVFISIGNDNWGLTSDAIPGRTANGTTKFSRYRGGGLEHALAECGKTPSDLITLLDDPRVLGWVANQQVSSTIRGHPKVLPIPIGVKIGNEQLLWGAMRMFSMARKTRLLLINSSEPPIRKTINKLVIDTFADHGYTLANLYNTSALPFDFYAQLAESKFVLCPAGVGHDTYRYIFIDQNPNTSSRFFIICHLCVVCFADTLKR